jgi:hypothetical protein
MPQFKSREEYERWKAERMGVPLESVQVQQEPEKLQTSQKSQEQKTPQPPQTPQPLRAADLEKRPSSNSPSHGQRLRSLGELFGDTWNLFKARFLTLICLYLLPVVFMVVMAGVFAGAGYFFVSILPISKAALIVGLILLGIGIGSIAMSWGLAAFTSAAVDDHLKIRDALAKGWPKARNFIWVSSLFAFIVGGGFFLFIIPGVIFLIWFLFSQFIVVAEDERGMNALLKSKEYVSGKWFNIFLRVLVLWLIYVGLSLIPVVGPILSILFIPFMILFMKLIYEDLRDLRGEVALHPHSFGIRFKWIGTGALGYIVFPVILFVLMGTTLTDPLVLIKGLLSNSRMHSKISEEIGATPIRLEQNPYQEVRAEEPLSQGQSVALAFSEGKKPEATGEALIIRDGVRETFVLQTGFFSDTRMANPRMASVQFQIPAEKHSNARRIEMVLDATKVGEHFVDGNFVRDTFMGRSGEESEQENKARFQYIADGGQIFFPEDSCDIIVTSPYTGDPNGIFSGEVKDCVVTSAGIRHTISAEFKVIGLSSR